MHRICSLAVTSVIQNAGDMTGILLLQGCFYDMSERLSLLTGWEVKARARRDDFIWEYSFKGKLVSRAKVMATIERLQNSLYGMMKQLEDEKLDICDGVDLLRNMVLNFEVPEEEE